MIDETKRTRTLYHYNITVYIILEWHTEVLHDPNKIYLLKFVRKDSFNRVTFIFYLSFLNRASEKTNFQNKNSVLKQR